MNIENTLKFIKSVGDLLPVIIGYAWTVILFIFNLVFIITVSTALHKAVPNSDYSQWLFVGLLSSTLLIVSTQLNALDGDKNKWSKSEILAALLMAGVSVSLQIYFLYKIINTKGLDGDTREITVVNGLLGMFIDFLLGLTSKVRNLTIAPLSGISSSKTVKTKTAPVETETKPETKTGLKNTDKDAPSKTISRFDNSEIGINEKRTVPPKS